MFLIEIIYTFSLVQRSIRLNTGRDCPVVGLGTGGFKKGGLNNTVRDMVRTAIDFGYRHIETSGAYGNERAVGQAVNELIAEGRVRREDLFISTKIFPVFLKGSKGRSRTLKSVKLALNRLNQTYVDLMLIHFPTPDPSVNRNVWFALEEALSLRAVLSIGVSNFNVTEIKNLLKKAKVIPSVAQVESHPLKSQKKLIEFCGRNGIRVSARLPLASGFLLNDTTVVSIGQKYSKTAAQVLIRWQLQRGVVAIPKSAERDGIEENINVFDFSLADEDMKSLDDMN